MLDFPKDLFNSRTKYTYKKEEAKLFVRTSESFIDEEPLIFDLRVFLKFSVEQELSSVVNFWRRKSYQILKFQDICEEEVTQEAIWNW